MAKLFHIPEEQDQQAQAHKVLNAIAATEPWLVVFDNAATAAAIRPYVERLGGDGHVLITSRDENWDGVAAAVSITQWSIPESVKFLLNRTNQTDEAAAGLLARDLDGLALALEHAAAYMKAGDGMSLRDYHQKWQQYLERTPKEQSVAATIGLSIDKVQQQSPVAYELLNLFAWLAPDRIPRKALLEAGAAALPPNIAAAFQNPDDWSTAIETLARHSLIRRDRTGGLVSGYYVHRVVQQIVRARPSETNWRDAACDLLSAAAPFDAEEPSSWAACEELLPHIRAMRERLDTASEPASFGRLLAIVGIYFRARGLYAESLDFSQLALAAGLRNLGPDHPNVAVHHGNLAQILVYLGDLPGALTQTRLALAAWLKGLGPDHPKVAFTRFNLAAIPHAPGDMPVERDQLQLALEADLKNLGPDHLQVALVRSNLAVILHALGDLPAALTEIQLALDSGLKTIGPDHPNIACYHYNLAQILHDLGDQQQALAEINQAIAIIRKALPPNHPHIQKAESIRAAILKRI